MLRLHLTVIHLLLDFHSMEDVVRWRGVCCQATERFDGLTDLLYFSRSGKKSNGCFTPLRMLVSIPISKRQLLADYIAHTTVRNTRNVVIDVSGAKIALKSNRCH